MLFREHPHDPPYPKSGGHDTHNPPVLMPKAAGMVDRCKTVGFVSLTEESYLVDLC